MFAGTTIEYSERGEGDPLWLVHAGVLADRFVPLVASQTLDGFCAIRVRRAGSTATFIPARALRVDVEVGTIEVGKRADLLVVDASPLIDISNICKSRWVVANGRMYETWNRAHESSAECWDTTCLGRTPGHIKGEHR